MTVPPKSSLGDAEMTVRTDRAAFPASSKFQASKPQSFLTSSLQCAAKSMKLQSLCSIPHRPDFHVEGARSWVEGPCDEKKLSCNPDPDRRVTDIRALSE